MIGWFIHRSASGAWCVSDSFGLHDAYSTKEAAEAERDRRNAEDFDVIHNTPKDASDER